MLLSRGKAIFVAVAGFLLCAGAAVGQVVSPEADSTLTVAPLTLPRDTTMYGINRLVSPMDLLKIRLQILSAEIDTLLNRNDTLAVFNDTLRTGLDTLAAGKSRLLNGSDTLAMDTSAIGLDTLAATVDTLDIITSEADINTIPGFRVQLLSTQNILQAITAKTKADSLLQNYNVYIVYDSPYYKVRVGDFRARYEANQAVSYIADHGFPDAWPVPDNIYRRPPKRSNN